MDWIKVYETNKLTNAEMMKIILGDNGVNSVIINKQDSSYGFGYIELFVDLKDKDIALQIIKESE
ncbi:MAG: hypothetical protein A2X12_00940 [Bacteroidetes bacterium GWE2_29_8]|nr:MAG: hypothetical protein A2X12_00940 [Bacteroidetes bacterium GWE2_29_8]OFY15643.1 MAG: hypothetical protein A2X02_06410 [Bacteroidetes bacterium GWF2_29_10]